YRTAYDEGELLEVRPTAASPTRQPTPVLPAFFLLSGFCRASRCVHRGLVAALLVWLALLTLAPRSAAQTFTWSGGAGNNRWTSGNNWSGGVAPTGTGGEDLVFPSGAARLSNNNTFNGASFNSITISGSGYTLGGNALTLGAGGLADNSIAGTNTISLGLAFAATRTVTVGNAGTTLTISGVISGAGGVS